MNALTNVQPKSLSVGMGIAGTSNAGKTLLAAKLINFLETLGIRDVKFMDAETPTEDFVDLQLKANYIDLPDDVVTTVFIQEVHTDTKERADSDSDGKLAAGQLAKRYENKEHPIHTRLLWKHDVFALDITDGYWDWVVQQIKRSQASA